LTAELARQQAINEELCLAFATEAKSFIAWLRSKKEILATPNADLEAYHAAVLAEQDDAGASTRLDACTEAEGKVAARDIERNPHTNLTTNDLRSQWTQFGILLGKKLELIAEQIEESKRAGLTEEQVKEIDDNFTFFDDNGNGFLNTKELRTCLQSLGEESNKAVVAEIFAKYNTDGDSKELNKEAFFNYMKDRLGDTDTAAEIIRSFKHLAYDADTVTQDQLTTVVNERTFHDHHVDYLGTNLENGDFSSWTTAVFNR
jgi:Ca2+-binding EF-hand superfamily protein